MGKLLGMGYFGLECSGKVQLEGISSAPSEDGSVLGLNIVVRMYQERVIPLIK